MSGRALISSIVGLLAVSAQGSEAPTFTRDVLPVLQQNCQICHRPEGLNLGGMVAPMALLSYEDAREHAEKIAVAVESRYMPPWHASTQHHGVFENERSLTDAEIGTIVRWVKNGMPHFMSSPTSGQAWWIRSRR